jgi:hypothetical protein
MGINIWRDLTGREGAYLPICGRLTVHLLRDARRERALQKPAVQCARVLGQRVAGLRAGDKRRAT